MMKMLCGKLFGATVNVSGSCRELDPIPPNVIKLDDSNDGYLVIPYSVITPRRPHLVPPEPKRTRQDQSMSALATFLILF